MDSDSKRLLKRVIKKIHPDLFINQPEYKEANTRALAVCSFHPHLLD